MQKVPLLDLKLQMAPLHEELFAELKAILNSGDFILGKKVKEFEEAFAQYLGVAHVVGCANGTDALVLILKALNIKPGDRVVTTSLTFAATVESIYHAGAVPVLLDVDPETELLNTTLLEKYLKSQKGSGRVVKAVVPVHLRGNPCNMDEYARISDEHGLFVVEDVAQAQGSSWKGKRIGGFGKASAFSFFPGKNLGALGDAGCVSTDDLGLADQIRRLRNHGRLSKYNHELVGFNSRLDTLQAAWLNIKLKHLNQWNTGRQKVAGFYNKQFVSAQQITTPQASEGGEHVFHHYAIRISNRDEVRAGLEKNNIATGIHYPEPVHVLPGFKDIVELPFPLPVTEEICRKTLSLPIYPELSEEDVGQIARIVTNIAK